MEQVYKDDPEFDEDCRDVIETRMIEHSYDYRLNPELQKACKEDVEKYCSKFLMHDYSVSKSKLFLLIFLVLLFVFVFRKSIQHF